VQQAIGRRFGDADEMFNWLHSVVVGLTTMHFACRSGFAHAIAAGPVDLAGFAAAQGLPQDKLERIARYLAAHELLAFDDEGFAVPSSHSARMAELHGLWQQMINTLAAGSMLDSALRAGKTGFESRFGKPAFEYLEDHPELGAEFGSFMSFMTSRTFAFLHDNYAFPPFETAVDVGGSRGDLLASVLTQRPGARGVLFDLPGVAAQTAAAIAGGPLAARIDIVAGSFFERVPPGDLFLLKQILHDWSDGECVEILSNIRAAMAPGGRLVVLDHLLGERLEPSEARSTDIVMMIWATGRERTRAEFAQLFGRAGFATGQVIENPSGHSVIEALPI
jgi:hypothetical protein